MFSSYSSAASKSLVWKALISVKNRQTQSGSVRCSWEITLIYISPCFQCILVPAYQNIEFPHWGMAWEMPTPLPLQQSNSFQTFSRVSFSWAALVFKKEQPSCLDERNFFQKEHHQCACSALKHSEKFLGLVLLHALPSFFVQNSVIAFCAAAGSWW